MGQEHSTTSSRERQKRGAPRAPPSRHRDSTPSKTPDPHATDTSTSKSSASSSGYTTATSRTTSSASSLASSNHLPIYRNSHYRDVNNNDIYKPLKINKTNIHKLKILNADKDTAIYLEKHLSIKSYLDSEEVKRQRSGPLAPEPTQKKAGIRNYTPKILSEKNPPKDLEHWI